MKVTIGNYLLSRLHELQVHHIFGVPGDYNLGFLDQVVESPLEWVGCCNELNAAYSADGYGRINGMGAIVTTFGVGELSAINGIAGSYAEYVPVIHIVGMPSQSTQSSQAIVHHTLGEGNFSTFTMMYDQVTLDHVVLNNLNAASEIDRLITLCWLKKRPVYIGLPVDIVATEIELEQITPLLLSYPLSDNEAVKEAVENTVSFIENAHDPVVLIDICAQRHGMISDLHQLLNKTGLPFASMTMGKSVLDESLPNYLGVYNGDISIPKSTQKRVEDSDCLISFGTLLSDFNTGGFSAQLKTSTTVDVHSHYVQLKHAIYKNVYFKDFIPALIKRLEHWLPPQPIPTRKNTNTHKKLAKGPISQKLFWSRMANYIKPNQVLIAEAGTSLFGAITMPTPDSTTFIAQPLWASIGYTVGALLGATLAAPNKQSILFIGDGSFQLTAQELSTMIRLKRNPVIFLINNNGYTVERVIHGPNMPYNDIQTWNYSKLPSLFGTNTWSQKVNTMESLEDALSESALHTNKLRFIEVIIDKQDSPEILKTLAASCAKSNEY